MFSKRVSFLLLVTLAISEYPFIFSIVFSLHLSNSFFVCYFSYLYQIAHLGDEDDEPEFSSAMPLEEGDTFFFAPRLLKNLVMVDELHSYAPILGCQVADLANEDTPQLYLLCGRGPRSSMRVLRHGLEVSEMAVSELPGNPNAVWTVKKRADGKLTKFECRN